MKNTNRNKQSQGDNNRNAIKTNADHVVKNPAMQYSGRSTDNMNINNPGNSVGGGLANSKNEDKNEAMGMDYNRAGNFKNTGENEQTAGKNTNYRANQVDIRAGKEGKTMVKNVGMHEAGELNNAEEIKFSAKLQGQQQGGNHGGGGLRGGKFGNQTKTNSVRIQQNNVDGDMAGGTKGKK